MSKRFPIFCLVLFPLLTAVFFLIGYFDPEGLYDRLLDEDGPVEWVTAVLIIVIGVIVLRIAWRLKRRGRGAWAVTATVLIALLIFLAGLEEISYGQRLFGWESSGFFMEHSDQQETNLHNVVQAYLKDLGLRVYKTRHFVALFMGAYGIALPMLWWVFMRSVGRDSLWRLVVPPLYLITGFALGCHMTLFDWPTGYEEEIGEAYLAVCVLIVACRVWLGLTPPGQPVKSDREREPLDQAGG